jgi:hypothetical protein
MNRLFWSLLVIQALIVSIMAFYVFRMFIIAFKMGALNAH